MTSDFGPREKKLAMLGFPPDQRTPEGPLVEAVRFDGLVAYASGQIPFVNDELVSRGKVPSEVGVDEAQRAAALCAANVLRAVCHAVGSLERIEYVIRLTGYVNADPDFADAHLVINGASQLVLDVLGDDGKHARTALGMAQLPIGASTEVEMVLRIRP